METAIGDLRCWNCDDRKTVQTDGGAEPDKEAV